MWNALRTRANSACLLLASLYQYEGRGSGFANLWHRYGAGLLNLAQMQKWVLLTTVLFYYITFRQLMKIVKGGGQNNVWKYEVLTAVNLLRWTMCCFGGTYCIIFRVEKEAKQVASWVGRAWKTRFDIGLDRSSEITSRSRERPIQPWRWRQYVLLKCWTCIVQHYITFQNTAFFNLRKISGSTPGNGVLWES